jgi:predicted house-cleaning NTP pyrophosphatase (Maf/HAM1 superfamily)
MLRGLIFGSDSEIRIQLANCVRGKFEIAESKVESNPRSNHQILAKLYLVPMVVLYGLRHVYHPTKVGMKID